MRLAKILLADGEPCLGLLDGNDVRLLDLSQAEEYRTLADILHAPDPVGLVRFLVDPNSAPIALDTVSLQAPIDHQEVWAAGVILRDNLGRDRRLLAGATG